MKDVMTFKSGLFHFSSTYDSAEINSLLVRANVLNETVADLPILPELSARLEPDIMYSSISGTAMIEGNAIIGEDVRRIAQGEDLDRYTHKDKQEIRNLIAAYSWLANVGGTGAPFVLTEKVIKEIHALVTRDIPHEHNAPGMYRNVKVRVGDNAHGGVYTPPKILEDIKMLMGEFIDWINSDEITSLDPFIRAALAHYYFCLIHPFGDGNGRTARLIEAALLQSSNIKYVPRELSNYYYRNVDEYYASFSKSIRLKNDMTPFITFVMNGVIAGLMSAKESIIYFIRRFSLREYYSFELKNKHITKRQYELLLLLLENPMALSLKDLQEKRPFLIVYGKASTQTARRDIKNLLSRNLLQMEAGGRYALNFRVLG